MIKTHTLTSESGPSVTPTPAQCRLLLLGACHKGEARAVSPDVSTSTSYKPPINNTKPHLSLVLSPNTEWSRPIHWPLSLDLVLPQHQPNADYCYLEPVIRVKPEQSHQMSVSTNPNLGGHVIQLWVIWKITGGFRVIAPFMCLKITMGSGDRDRKWHGRIRQWHRQWCHNGPLYHF